MNKIFNLVKKELDKIFKNPRAILSTFILPGLLIFIIYTVMGTALQKVVQQTGTVFLEEVCLPPLHPRCPNESCCAFPGSYHVIGLEGN